MLALVVKWSLYYDSHVCKVGPEYGEHCKISLLAFNRADGMTLALWCQIEPKTAPRPSTGLAELPRVSPSFQIVWRRVFVVVKGRPR